MPHYVKNLYVSAVAMAFSQFFFQGAHAQTSGPFIEFSCFERSVSLKGRFQLHSAKFRRHRTLSESTADLD